MLLTGGADNLLLTLCSRLVRSGYRVTLYAAYPPVGYGAYGSMKADFEETGVIVRTNPSWMKPLLMALGFILFSPAIAVYPFLNRPDEVTLYDYYRHLFHAYIERFVQNVYQVMIFCRLAYDNIANDYRIVSGYHASVCFSLYLIKKWLKLPVLYTEISSPKWRRNLAEAKRITMYLNSFDAVFTPSSYIAHELKYYDKFLGDPINSRFFLDLPDFSYEPPRKDARTFGIIARLSPEKNQDVLIRALSQVKHVIPDAKCILIGRGPSEHDYRMQAERDGVAESIEFIGHFDKISDVISRIDIVTLISDVEGMPLTLIEALYYGKPIIATNVGSIPEMVIHGFNGYIIEKSEISALTEHLILLMQNRQLYSDMSENSRTIYSQKFDPDNEYNRLLYHYRKYCGNSNGEIP